MLDTSLKKVITTIGSDIKSIQQNTSNMIQSLDMVKADKTAVETVKSNLETLETTVDTKFTETKKELDTKISKNGGIFENTPTIDKKTGWSDIAFVSDNGEKSYIEAIPSSSTGVMLGFVRRDSSGNVIANVRVPRKHGTVATLDDRTSIDGKVGKTSLIDIMSRYSHNSSEFRNLSNPRWNQKGMFSAYFTQLNTFENQPTQYGQLINLPPTGSGSSNECAQLWIEQPSGHIWFRGANGSTAGNLKDNKFKKVATVDDINSLSSRRYITEEAFDNNTGGFYRIWSDGWIEQGGFVNSRATFNTVTFYQAYRRNPIVIATVISDADAYMGQYNANPSICNISRTNFKTAIKDNDKVAGWFWKAEGYKA